MVCLILAEDLIKRYVSEGKIIIDPFDEKNVEPSSYDLTLDRKFLVPVHSSTLDVSEKPTYKEVDSDEFVIGPSQFVLATTREWIGVPNTLTAFIEGRSSVGRLGLFIHNAGWIDPGFRGRITLELFNANPFPLRLRAGMRICQIIFSEINGSTPGYTGKYLGQDNVVGSRLYMDFGGSDA